MMRMPGYTLASPTATLEYFKAALSDTSEQAVRHQYLCFSDALKTEILRKHGRAFTLETYMQVREDVRAYVAARIGGDIAAAEVGADRSLGNGLAAVNLSLAGRQLVVQLVQETNYSIWWTDPMLGRTDGTLPFGTEAAELTPQTMLLRLSSTEFPSGTEHPQVYRVSYEKSWRVLGVEGSDLATDVERFVQERAREREAAPKH
ncbi:MAG: hypothetical protein EXS14_05810 [Planctomycetes bacterium]|nr:hypothetical protein [Planctomycetota bacterium]